MIKLTYTPWKPTFADASEPSPVQELNMTIGDSVTWEEATTEFHNFLRGAGYVIPYNLEWHLDYSDPPDRDKSGSLGDRQPEWANSMSGGDDDWDESDTDVAEKTAWVGITNEDYEVGGIYVDQFLEGVDWAEAKLREKNT